MKTILICPSERPEVKTLSHALPLAAVPLLGQSLVEYWLSHLATSGAKQVLVLAHDRPNYIADIVETGARWGLEAKVVIESREPTPSQVLLKYAGELDPVPAPNSITILDHFPGRRELPLFRSYADLFAGLGAWMPQAVTPDRVGMREFQPGVWVGLHSHIASGARLLAPCWIGRHVFIGADVVIGPNTVIEDRAMIEPAAELTRSWVGCDTFVGRFSQLADSLAWGCTLVNWQTGSVIQVPDPFLLCALRQPRQPRKAGWFARLAELYARGAKEEVYVPWKQLPLNKEG